MEWFTDIFHGDISAWHWASLGVLLLIFEIFGAAGFLIGSAIAAFLMAFILVFVPGMDWKWQLVIFSTAAVIFSIIYLKRFAGFNEQTDQPTLNNRAAVHIGKHYTLKENIVDGRGRIQVGDTFWKLHCNTDLKQGTRIEVTSTDGMALVVKSAEEP